MHRKSRQHLSLAATLALLSLAGTAQGANQCEWETTPGPMMFSHNLSAGSWVPRDAPVGAKIASWTTLILFGAGPQKLVCDNDGTGVLTANVTTSLPVASGTFPPIDGKDVNGKVLQTSIPGVGLYIEMGSFLNGTANNHFRALDGIGAVPFQSQNSQLMTPTNLVTNTQRIAYVALIKTGTIAPGPQMFNQEVARANISDVGDALRLSLSGQVMQAQCTLKADAVSANPVMLGSHDIADFTGVGTTTAPVDFFITLSDCEDDPNGSVARAFMRLDGVDGSVPIDRDLGLFSLTTDSSAKGLGIQVMRNDGTPIKLEEFVDMAAVSPGTMRLDLRARYRQTDAAVTPGVAKGALNFTLEYR